MTRRCLPYRLDLRLPFIGLSKAGGWAPSRDSSSRALPREPRHLPPQEQGRHPAGVPGGCARFVVRLVRSRTGIRAGTTADSIPQLEPRSCQQLRGSRLCGCTTSAIGLRMPAQCFSSVATLSSTRGIHPRRSHLHSRRAVMGHDCPV